MSGLPRAINEHLRKARSLRTKVLPGDSITTHRHKEYPRFPRISLELPTSSISLAKVAAARSSQRDVAGRPPSLRQLGELFGISMREHTDNGHRPYPSGGALYPIEAYLIGKIGEEIPYAYHYRPSDHSLEKLWPIAPERMRETSNDSWVNDIPCLLVLTARWFRSEQKYGDFSYNLSLLETGHIAQNLLLSSVAADLLTCPIGGFDEKVISDLLDLDPREEDPLYLITLSN